MSSASPTTPPPAAGDGGFPSPKGGPAPDNASVPKPKRLACMICRKRKLKCDGVKPSCSTCSRLGHTCAYDEVRRKSGPKRGYVKALEERLKQVETLLNKSQDPAPGVGGNAPAESSKRTGMSIDTSGAANQGASTTMPPNLTVPNPSISIAADRDMDRWHFNGESPQPGAPMDDFNFNSAMPMPGMNNVGNNFTWEMIGLGLEEPLPQQDTIDELHQIYFEKVHPSIPMIHKYRYLAAMNLAPSQRPPVCLRYAIWTQACSITERMSDLKDLFYQRARKYLEADYIKGYGEHMISVAHAQTHILLASYEYKMMYFPRAWMSTGSAVRLCQMIGLHRLDGAGLDVKQCLPPPRDWTEREERRRTFWMAFCDDRYGSIGTGWPMSIEEKDILTNLPATDEAFDMSRPEQTQTLVECMSPAGATKLSSFGGVVLMACLFGRNLVHLHRPDPDDRDNDLNGEFWKRHRSMDNILLNTSLCLPPHLKLPQGLASPNVVFTNMSIHTSTICLHQAAIFKADKNKLPASVSAESKVRCITAANEIASTMRMISHMDLSSMNPFISFCLYVAARVFVQYLKSRSDDSQTADSLRFLLSAMNALKRKNPLTESFLAQLDVDLEALGARIPKLRSAFPRNGDSPEAQSNNTAGKCEGEGIGGILAYRDADCGSSKKPDNPNTTSAPPPHSSAPAPTAVEANEAEGGHQRDAGSGMPPFDSNSWLPPTTSLSHEAAVAGHFSIQNHVLTPNSGTMYDKGGAQNQGMPFGHVDASGDSSNTHMTTSSPDRDPSNRPTPNSSAASDHRSGANVASNGMDTSGPNSFNASPAPGCQSINSGNVENGGGGGGAANFFGDPRQFGMTDGSGMTPGRGFAMGNPQMDGFAMSTGGWQGMPGADQQMPSLSDPNLMRSLMDMAPPPMDPMDLTPWNTT